MILPTNSNVYLNDETCSDLTYKTYNVSNKTTDIFSKKVDIMVNEQVLNMSNINNMDGVSSNFTTFHIFIITSLKFMMSAS